MKPASNYHQHSAYSDGQGSLEDYARAALAAGLTSMGFSDHAPVDFVTEWTMPLDRLAAYHGEVQSLKAAYREQMELHTGLEMDYIPGIREWQRQQVLSLGWDYVIGSIHYLGDVPPGQEPWSIDESRQAFERVLHEQCAGDMHRLADLYYATVRDMVRAGDMDIVGHFDYIKRYNDHSRYFSEGATWYQRLVEETLRVIAGKGLLVEVNTGGWRCPCGSAWPTRWILHRCWQLGIPITVNSDAHKPPHLTSGLARGLRLAREVGYTEVMRLTNGRWTATPTGEGGP